MHALGIAESLGITRVVIPPALGLFGSLALLFGDVEHHFVQTYFRKPGEIDPAPIERILAELEAEGHSTLAAEGYNGARARRPTTPIGRRSSISSSTTT